MNTATKKHIFVILGTAHGYEVKGKCAPDKSLYEWKWSREICSRICKELQDEGYRAIVDHEGNNEIGLSNRAQIVNNYAQHFGKKTTLYVSIHINAAGADGKWHKATGWESHIAKNASENSKRIANIFWEKAQDLDVKLRRPTPTQNYWENNFTVLTKTISPAILTENMFQDNKSDVEWLLSKEGKDKIVNLHKEAIKEYIATTDANGNEIKKDN